ncbi:MAG: hypothetical protein H6895_07300 [Defluviimonas sp.]|uniref:hypothetical protein n=1 Tax=Albidovulum sp. TaxID=1872424 RepID=UPI001DF9EF0C|nr:hypothetical protein [Paracoccaceae bacterium]MCC0063876.1 hypothetical protein [Defluviimonas sp.]
MGGEMNVTGKVDINTFVDQAAKLAKGLDAGTSLLYNNSGKKANFYCYNGGDFVMAIPYSKPTIATGCSGLIAAGGSVFKVFADNKGDAEFLVKPNRAYVYGGPGDVREL